MTATSVVPPPMSTTTCPPGSWIGRPAPIEGDDGRLGEDDATPPHVDERVRRAEVDPDVADEALRETKFHGQRAKQNASRIPRAAESGFLATPGRDGVERPTLGVEECREPLYAL